MLHQHDSVATLHTTPSDKDDASPSPGGGDQATADANQHPSRKDRAMKANTAARKRALLEHTHSSSGAPELPDDKGPPRRRSTVRHDSLIVLDGDGSDLMSSKV